MSNSQPCGFRLAASSHEDALKPWLVITGAVVHSGAEGQHFHGQIEAMFELIVRESQRPVTLPSTTFGLHYKVLEDP